MTVEIGKPTRLSAEGMDWLGAAIEEQHVIVPLRSDSPNLVGKPNEVFELLIFQHGRTHRSNPRADYYLYRAHLEE